MTYQHFNTLELKERLKVVYYNSKEVDYFIAWSEPLRIVKIYSHSTFFIEVVCHLRDDQGITKVYAFDDFQYLQQYHQFTYLMERKVRWLTEDNEELPNT